MKQFIFITFIVLLIGCKKDPSGNKQQPITNTSIGFMTDVLTKGVTTTSETIADFGVFSYRTKHKDWINTSGVALPNIFDNVKVIRQANGTWDYGTPKTWGDGDGEFMENFTFFGYSPYATTLNGIVAPTANIAGEPVIKFTVRDEVATQIDLLVAKPIYDMKPIANSVMMNFEHALCRIGFKAFAKNDNISVKSISLKNIKYIGSLSLKNQWNSNADKRSFALTYAPVYIIPVSIDTEIDAINISEAATSPQIYSDNHFLILPQNLTSNVDAKIVFVYSVGSKEHTKEYTIKENWSGGVTVTYTIDLTTEVETPLKVTNVSITPWGATQIIDGNGDGKIEMMTLTYNDGGAITTVKTPKNDYAELSKPTDLSKIWNTKQDGTGVSYSLEDRIYITQDATLYSVDNFVQINGIKWLKTNLSGRVGTVDVFPTAYPQNPGRFFQWGSQWVYQREDSFSDGLIGVGDTGHAPTIPQNIVRTGGDLAYDYVSLDNASGRSVGDPCTLLGTTFRTPSHQQFLDLNNLGTHFATYGGIKGCFFGTLASSCTNDIIREGCIFLPLNGMRFNSDGQLYHSNERGCYWEATMTNEINVGRYFLINDSGKQIGINNTYDRNAGMAVRCIQITN